MSVRRHYILAALVAILIVQPVLGSEARFIDIQSPTSLGLGIILWAAVIYLILVYGFTIRTSVRSEAWDTLTAGMVLFVIGLILFQASVFVVPLQLLVEASNHVPYVLPHVKMSLLFLTVFVLVLFLVDWCKVFELHPTVLAPPNVKYAVFALLIAGAGTVVPMFYNPHIMLQERVYIFPIVGIAAFVVANLYFTVSGILIVRESPVFRRFRWMIADSVFVTAFLGILVYEFWVYPEPLRQTIFPETLFYIFTGLFFLIVGYIYKLRALIIFTKAFVIGPRKGPRKESKEVHISADILDYLAGKFLKTTELESAVGRILRENKAMKDVTFNPDKRSFDLTEVDLSDDDVQRGVSDLFFAIIYLLKELEPPKIDKDYTEDSLKVDILTHFATTEERPPPGVEGYILPKTLVLAQAVSEVMNKFLGSIPLEAGFTKVVINAIDGVWGGEFVRSEGGRITFDGDAFLTFCKDKGATEKDMVRYISRLYLRAHRLALEPFKNVMSRDKVGEIMMENVKEVASKPLYRSAGVSDIMVNAFFADSHPWGFGPLNRTIGKIPNKYTLLLTYEPEFPKEQFISGLLTANLRAYRNAVWVAQARHGITRHLLSEGVDVDTLLEDDRLLLLSMDPNIEDSKETTKGCRTIGVTFNKLSYELKQALDDFPVSSIIVVVELPVSAVKGVITMLYKFVFHIKAMCEKYDATLIIAADSTICGEETVAMLKGIAELVVDARDGVIVASSVSEGSTSRLTFGEKSGQLTFEQAEDAPKKGRGR